MLVQAFEGAHIPCCTPGTCHVSGAPYPQVHAHKHTWQPRKLVALMWARAWSDCKQPAPDKHASRPSG